MVNIYQIGNGGGGEMRRRKVDLKKIKLLRKRSFITLEKMAKKLGYDSPNGYYYLECGRSKFSAEMLAFVADILDVKLEELFCTAKDDELSINAAREEKKRQNP
jgi:transcriptional regulator with XRE-family HTH domain